MDAFTPGPWTASIARITPKAGVFGYIVRAGKKLHSVANVGVYEHEPITHGELPEDTHPDVVKRVAQEFYTEEELIANAHLIAAAPDLLNACEAALNDRMFKDWPEVATLLKNAINKARGA